MHTPPLLLFLFIFLLEVWQLLARLALYFEKRLSRSNFPKQKHSAEDEPGGVLF